MLPPEPPTVSPVDMEVDTGYASDEEDDGPTIQLSSIEINLLIHQVSFLAHVLALKADKQYLTESNFSHTAFTLLNESKLADTDLYKHYNPREPTHKTGSKANGNRNSPVESTFGNINGRLPPAGLIKKLWKAVRWEEVERHIGQDGVSSFGPYSVHNS
jgi:transducin (beta)-like 1